MKKLVGILFFLSILLTSYGENLTYIYLGENESLKSEDYYKKLKQEIDKLREVDENIYILSSGIYQEDSEEFEASYYVNLGLDVVLAKESNFNNLFTDRNTTEDEENKNEKLEKVFFEDFISLNVYGEGEVFPIFKGYKTFYKKDIKTAVMGLNSEIDNETFKTRDSYLELRKTIKLLNSNFGQELNMVLSSIELKKDGKWTSLVEKISKLDSPIIFFNSSVDVLEENPILKDKMLIVESKINDDKIIKLDIIFNEGKIEKYALKEIDLNKIEIDEEVKVEE